MTAAMVMFAGVGHYLDKRSATATPWFTLAGMFLALVYSGYEVWKIVRQGEADAASEEHKEE